MSIINAYIVFILRIGEDLVSGFTTDINNTLVHYKAKSQQPTLVFQRHFDDPDKAKSFAEDLKGWDHQKKEALINGRINFS